MTIMTDPNPTFGVTPRQADVRRQHRHLGRTLRRILIGCSLLASIVMLKISFDHPGHHENVPVFNAKGLPLWHQPADQGGAATKYTGFAVNRIISGQAEPAPTTFLSLAPQQPALPAEALSLRGMRALQRGAGHSQEPDATETTGSRRPTPDIPAGLRDPETLDVELVIAKILSSRSDITGVEVMPDSVLSGTYVAQVGIFSEREQAANRLVELLNSFPRLLGAANWMIEPFALANRNSHRLRFLGFARYTEAETFCQKLVTRGVQCVPTLVF